MKLQITTDDVHVTKYTVGRMDFYTRTVEVDPAVASKIQKIEELYEVSQRILAALYSSSGKFILPDDLKRIECVDIEPATGTQPSAKTPKPLGSAPALSSGLRKP